MRDVVTKRPGNDSAGNDNIQCSQWQYYAQTMTTKLASWLTSDLQHAIFSKIQYAVHCLPFDAGYGVSFASLFRLLPWKHRVIMMPTSPSVVRATGWLSPYPKQCFTFAISVLFILIMWPNRTRCLWLKNLTTFITTNGNRTKYIFCSWIE